MVLTEGKRSDLAVARRLQLPTGSIVAMDRGYIDYGFLFRLTQEGVYFIDHQQGRFQVRLELVLQLVALVGHLELLHQVIQCGEVDAEAAEVPCRAHIPKNACLSIVVYMNAASERLYPLASS